MKIYEFLYCSCVHESGYSTISLHRTKEGAEKTMKNHKKNERRKFNKMYKGTDLEQYMTFGKHEDWRIGIQELLD